MNAFNKSKNKPTMPTQLWAIFDNDTGLWCSHYSINLNFCTWGSDATAQIFATKQSTDDAIEAWGETPGERFIGKNPKPH